jgi:hypothetical protein
MPSPIPLVIRVAREQAASFRRCVEMVIEARESSPLGASEYEASEILEDMWFRDRRSGDEFPKLAVERALQWACREAPPPPAVLREARAMLEGVVNDWTEAILMLDQHFRRLSAEYHWPRGFHRLKTAALAEQRRVMMLLRESWPVGSEEEEQRALADLKEGKGVELDDAFAEIAGVSKEEWLRRVAEHKEKRR